METLPNAPIDPIDACRRLCAALDIEPGDDMAAVVAVSQVMSQSLQMHADIKTRIVSCEADNHEQDILVVMLEVEDTLVGLRGESDWGEAIEAALGLRGLGGAGTFTVKKGHAGTELLDVGSAFQKISSLIALLKPVAEAVADQIRLDHDTLPALAPSKQAPRL